MTHKPTPCMIHRPTTCIVHDAMFTGFPSTLLVDSAVGQGEQQGKQTCVKCLPYDSMFSSRLRRILRSVDVKSLATQGTTRLVNSSSSMVLPICTSQVHSNDADNELAVHRFTLNSNVDMHCRYPSQ